MVVIAAFRLTRIRPVDNAQGSLRVEPQDAAGRHADSLSPCLDARDRTHDVADDPAAVVVIVGVETRPGRI